MKKRILSLVLCAAMLLSMCLFLGAGVTNDGETCKITVNYIYQSDKTAVAPTAVLEARKGETLTQGIDLPQRDSFTPQLEKNYEGVSIDKVDNQLVFNEYSVTGNMTINVLYVAGQAKYTVEFYFQNIDDDEYTKDETKTTTLEGDVNAYTNAVATAYPGFTAEKFEQQQITPDEKTCIKIYYTRNYYMVQFDANGGVNGPEPIYAKYGTEYTIPNGENAPTKQGYNFNGWWSDGKLLTEGKVKGNVTYTADWRPASGKASVTVVYWGQNANDNEYSYYGASVLGDQTVGSTITWADIQNQTAYTCGLEEHTHTSDCKLNCVHTVHDLTCYGLSANAQPITPSNEATKYFAKLSGGVQDGYIYYFDDRGYNGQGDQYYLRLNGEYYKYDGTPRANKGAQVGGRVACNEGTLHSTDYFYKYNLTVTCTHKHTAACYSCGKIEHTHTGSCMSALNAKMDSSLWTYEKSDTVTVDAAGNTIMNVYYTRTKVTLYFEGKGSYTITDRWGADIEDRFKSINAAEAAKYTGREKLQGWHDSRSSESDTMTNYIGVMPKPEKNKITFTAVTSQGNNTAKWTYYREDLNGKDQFAFDVEVKYSGTLSVSSDDYYTFEGFECDKDRSTKEGETIDGAKFYYKRKQYTLNFFNGDASKAETVKKLKFEEPLSNSYYEPVNRPAGVERDAEFAGWYLNPQCTGEQYDFSTSRMPANDIALYAKWVNRSYTVTTYTDESLQTLYTHDDYNGSQSVVKYEKGVAPTNPTKSGFVFVGWFYEEGGVEKPFSFEMGITKDYDLYPKWSDKADVSYTVEYKDQATGKTIAPEDKFTTRIGNQVTITAKPIDNYFPEKSSFSETIDVADKVVTVWYTSATVKSYTVRYVEIVNGQQKDLTEPVSRTTSSMRVVERAKTIPGYTAKQFEIAHDVTAGEDNFEIVFEYIKYVTINYVALEGGKVDQGTETLIRTTDTAQGSTATADASYKFVGWYDNRECTGNPVSTDAKFVPQQVNGVYEEATYYAKFELDVFDLTIKKTAKDGTTIDPNQIFVFHVVSENRKTDMEVTVQGTGSVTIKGLPLGTTYTVTEDTNWTWQYTPDKASQKIEPNGDSTVTFTNTYSKSNWLTSFAEVINKWINGKIEQTEIKN